MTPSAVTIGIVGSRDFAELPIVVWTVRTLAAHAPWPITIVSGHARGVDRLAEETAHELGLHVLSLKVTAEQWQRSRGAGFERNSQIVNYSNGVIAFWDGTSHGTYDTITKAAAAQKLIRTYIEGSVRPGKNAKTTGENIAFEALEWLDERIKQSILK